MANAVVIKAAADYADSHKNKAWQTYAAGAAACVARAFIEDCTSHETRLLASQLGVKKDTGNIHQQNAPDLQHWENGFTVPCPLLPSSAHLMPGLYHHDPSLMDEQEADQVSVPPGLLNCLDQWYHGISKNLLLWGRDRAGWLDAAAHQMARGLVRQGQVAIFVQLSNINDDLVNDFWTLLARALPNLSGLERDLSKLEAIMNPDGPGIIVFFHRLVYADVVPDSLARLLVSLFRSSRFRVFVSSEDYLPGPDLDGSYNVHGLPSVGATLNLR
jgi:hypothetical protein